MRKFTLLITVILTTLVFVQAQGQEQIVYDNDTNTGYQPFDPNDVYSVHFSPTGPCELLSVQYYTDGGVGVFGTFLYPWDETLPGFPALYEDILTANSGSDPQWQSKDIPGNLTFDVDGFVVGFLGSVQINLGIDDSSDDSGRNWIWNQTGWDLATTYNFQIRATVEYTTTGVIEELQGSMIDVYPNPANEVLYIDASTDIQKVSFYTISGKLVKSMDVQAGKTQLNLNGLESGVYLLNIENGNDVITKKVIIQ
jgi:hypothetical protein